MTECYGFGKVLRRAGMVFAGLLMFAVTSCSRELTPETALEEIIRQDEFRMPYYAPMRIGELVLTGENHKDSKGYIRKHYGPLIDAGLVEVTAADHNTWRTVIDVQLSEKGRAMSDKRRSTDKEAYVQVCRMVPVRIDEFRTVSEGNVIECTYSFEERDVTPFGAYKGFEAGRSYKDKRTFVRARGSWHVQ